MILQPTSCEWTTVSGVTSELHTPPLFYYVTRSYSFISSIVELHLIVCVNLYIFGSNIAFLATLKGVVPLCVSVHCLWRVLMPALLKQTIGWIEYQTPNLFLLHTQMVECFSPFLFGIPSSDHTNLKYPTPVTDSHDASSSLNGPHLNGCLAI